MERLNKFSRLINKVYYNLFVELDKKKKITFNFTEEKRWDLLNQIIKIKKIENYLEIGCDNNDLFEKINVPNKIGVDPREGGNVRKTSDEFFKYNKKNFELIFIDGLHEYDQVNRDIENSLNCLANDGLILLHDCLPATLRSQAVPRYSYYWNGDVWKSIVKFRHHENLNIKTIKIDEGISVIKKCKNQNILNLNIKDYKNLKFEDFYNNYKDYMNLINYSDFIKSI